MENDEQVEVTRHHNRALRRVNKVLRASHKLTKEYNDALFEELCTPSDNDLAIEKLWAFGGFTGPLDLEVLVDTCLKALGSDNAR